VQQLAVEPKIGLQLKGCAGRVSDEGGKDKGGLACGEIDCVQGGGAVEVDYSLGAGHPGSLPECERAACGDCGVVDSTYPFVECVCIQL
jgi:hypothetical protein